jgi:hypothetical protein
MDNKKPPKKPKVATRQPATVRALAPASRSTAIDFNRSSQPQALEVVSLNMSSWIRNYSYDQSVHLVGTQVDDEHAVERSQPGNYEENLSFDQSFAITGPTSQKTLEMMTKTWLELAKHAVDKKKEDNRELRPSPVYRLVIDKASKLPET